MPTLPAMMAVNLGIQRVVAISKYIIQHKREIEKLISHARMCCNRKIILEVWNERNDKHLCYWFSFIFAKERDTEDN
jgi:hypothetical protein